MRTKKGRPVQVSGNDVWTDRGKYVGRIRNGKLFDTRGVYVATVVGDILVYRRSDSATRGSASPRLANKAGTAAPRSAASAILGEEPKLPE